MYNFHNYFKPVLEKEEKLKCFAKVIKSFLKENVKYESLQFVDTKNNCKNKSFRQKRTFVRRLSRLSQWTSLIEELIIELFVESIND